MARRIIFFGAVLAVLAAVGLLIPVIAKARLLANAEASRNNLREIALFAAHHTQPDPKADKKKLPNEIPAGTAGLFDLPPDERLGWGVAVLPGLDQRRVNSEQLLAAIDKSKPWNAEPNQRAARTVVPQFLCPENTPSAPPGAPAITCYVAIGGVGRNAPALPVDDPKAGAMRFDSPTPFDTITDGLSQTLLFGETRYEVGPWLRGGSSTLRGLDDTPGAPPLIGASGQFGGYFPGAAHFAFCDGSVRSFTDRGEPRVLLGLATRAGKGTDPIPLD